MSGAATGNRCKDGRQSAVVSCTPSDESRQSGTGIDGITAESLNKHYAAVSTDQHYVKPRRRRQSHTETRNTPPNVSLYVSEWQIFQMLDKLRSTAPGADGLPAWFLRLGAPFLCKDCNPLTYLFKMSMATFTVPYQWKQATIRPTAKVSAPKTMYRLSADICHSNTYPHDGENCCPIFRLSHLPQSST